MFIKKIKMAGLVALMAYLPVQANAWGVLGHRIVGEIADAYLKPKTRQAIQGILGYETLAMSANWADFIKSDTAYNYLNSWHYVNLPERLSQQDLYTYLEKYPVPNVYSKISEMIAQLKNPKSKLEQRKFALRMLIHLVGDLHQPMHTARKDDLGGNKVALIWFGERSNLHKVWDEGLIDYQQLSYTEYAKAINHPTTSQMYNWQKSSLKDCVWESYSICNKIYEDIKPEARLSYRYNFDWINTLNEQLLRGGVRLAAILNDIYAK